jgi:hypothetical protein
MLLSLFVHLLKDGHEGYVEIGDEVFDFGGKGTFNIERAFF